MSETPILQTAVRSVYRADLDGLRAVAVIPVVLYHFSVPGMTGGFVGVDVFFVLSGFFITHLLLADLKAQSFSIVTFYERRARRLLPALYAMLAIVSILSFFLLLPEDFTAYARSMFATLVFASNIYFWRNSDYFDADAELSPLLHTWSLSVEEQFYILFPIVLWVVYKFARRHLAALLAVGWLASFAIAVWASAAAPVAGFYLPPSRAWELLTGSLLAAGAFPIVTNPRLRDLGGLAGLLMILGSVALLTPQTPFPGWWALLPCLGTGLVIAMSLSGESLVGRALAARPMVFVGRISYSLYLWHWPIVVFFRYWTGEPPNLFEAACMFALALALATASFHWVEQPFRKHRGWFTRARLAATLAVGAIALGACAVVIDVGRGLPDRFPAAVRPDAGLEIIPARCFNLSGDQVRAGETCVIGAATAARPSFAIWGDSHALRWATPLSRLAGEQGLRGLNLTHGACPPILGVAWPEPGCREFNLAAVETLVGAEVQTVYISGKWADYAEGMGYPEFDVPQYFYADGISSVPTRENNHQVFARNLLSTIRKLRAAGMEVVVIGPVPEVGWDVPRFIARRDIFGTRTPAPPDRDAFLKRQATVFRTLDLAAGIEGVSVLRPHIHLCRASTCDVQRDGKLLYNDDNHLSVHGTALFDGDLRRSLLK